VSNDPEHIDYDLVTVCVERAVGGKESRRDSTCQIETKFRSVCTLKQAVGCTGVQTSQKMRHYLAGPQNDRHGYAGIPASI